MAKKYTKYKKQPFESRGDKFVNNWGKSQTDTSANIFESMLQSQAFCDLKTKTQVLYLLCKAQFFGKRKPREDFPDIERLQDNACFYLCKKDLVEKYHFATKYCDKELYGYDDVKTGRHINGYFEELEEHGFIDIVSHCKSSRQKNIYKFSSRWQQWTKPKE